MQKATRRFGYRTIIRDVDLDVSRGDIIAVMGPNGAGKTTLLKILAGLTRPNAGTVQRHGTVFAVMHETLLYDTLTAFENLVFSARMVGSVDQGRIAELLEAVGLGRWRDERVLKFSRGMKQRLSIARALLHDPDILLLDEPLNSLDEQGCSFVFDLLQSNDSKKRAVVLVTHQVDRFLEVASGIGFLVGGTLHGPLPAANMTKPDVVTKYRELVAHA